MRVDLPAIEVLGVPIVRASSSEVLGVIEQLVEDPAPALVAYANAHTLNLATADPVYREVLRGADLVLNDGSGLAIAARMKGARFPENLNGTDLNPRILELCARRRWPVFFLGAAPGVAEGAAGRMAERIPGLQVAGHHHGYSTPDQSTDVIDRIRSSGAMVLMVAMGNPRQEMWLADHLGSTGCDMGVGVGAFFDFTAERVRRAPAWMSRWGIEWVFRLAQEPGRMWRRYVLGNPLFLWRVARDAWGSRRDASA